jgi:hypothetical protein
LTLKLRVERKGYIILPKAVREIFGIDEADGILHPLGLSLISWEPLTSATSLFQTPPSAWGGVGSSPAKLAHTQHQQKYTKKPINLLLNNRPLPAMNDKASS